MEIESREARAFTAPAAVLMRRCDFPRRRHLFQMEQSAGRLGLHPGSPSRPKGVRADRSKQPRVDGAIILGFAHHRWAP